MLLLYTIDMGYIGLRFCLKKKGQAMIETMLLIALLVPILIYSVNTIKTKLGGALTGFLTNELRTQVRYGYSYQEMKDVAGGFNTGALPNTQGTMPITQSAQGGAVVHPVQKVQDGWVQ
jgi:hypothetical protein